MIDLAVEMTNRLFDCRGNYEVLADKRGVYADCTLNVDVGKYPAGTVFELIVVNLDTGYMRLHIDCDKELVAIAKLELRVVDVFADYDSFLRNLAD